MTGRLLRAPRYGPDGEVLAFVDLEGWVGLLERADPELARVPFGATAAPIWLADGSAVLLTGSLDGVATAGSHDAPIPPLEPGAPDAVYRLGRSASRPTATALGPGYRVLAVAPDGTIAYATDEGALGITTSLDDLGEAPAARSGRVVAAAFAPGEATMVIEVEDVDGAGGSSSSTSTLGTRTPLVPDGSRPRWLP